jgi:hypothetical protein
MVPPPRAIGNPRLPTDATPSSSDLSTQKDNPYSNLHSSAYASSSRASRSTSYGPSVSTVSDGRTSYISFSNHSNVLSIGYLPATKWRFLRHLCLADNTLNSISASGLLSLRSEHHHCFPDGVFWILRSHPQPHYDVA